MPSDTSTGLYRTIASRYGPLQIFANDVGAASQSLLKYGEWAQNELDFLRGLIDTGTTVVDVGAYIGTHTLAFANFVGPTGSVIAIEAQDSSFRRLQQNVDLNGLTNIVRLEHAMISGQVGEVAISAIDISHESSFGSASLVSDLAQVGQTTSLRNSVEAPRELTRSLTIDSLQLSECSLMKIDVEGMEDQVLLGAMETIRRMKPIIYAECNSLEYGLKTLRLMQQHGYRTFAHVVRAYNYQNFRGDAANIFNEACEVGLLAVQGKDLARITNYPTRTCELLLEIESADDLALALLNKPQYRHEVLLTSAAADSGAMRCFETLDLILKEARNEQKAAEELRQQSEQRCRALELESRQTADILQATESRLEAEIDTREKLESMLKVIYSSRSWQLTAPARALRAWMRRLAGRD